MKKQNPEKLEELISKLHQRFEGAIHFLKETSVSPSDNRTKLFSLPWFIMLGFPDSGKTSLLSQTHLDFVLSKKNHQEKHRLSHCEWWATREAVFLDVNNLYVLQNRKTRRQRKLWFDFLELLRAHRRGTSFQGVVFSIDVEKLCSTHKNERNAYFHSIRGRLKDLAGYARLSFPLYFVLTKVDKLVGFSEFFDHLTKTEAAQLWGITFSQTQIQTPQIMADAFDLEFDNLLARLNQGLIQRLHHERNVDKRAVMKDFPLQVESIKKPLAAFLQNVSDITVSSQPCQLRGLYFSAAHPDADAMLDRLSQPLSQTFALQTWMPKLEVTNHRAYFTADIFKQLLIDRTMLLMQTKQGKAKFSYYVQWGMAIACGVFSISLVGNWVQLFSRNMADLNAIEQAMAQYQGMLTNQGSLDLAQLNMQLTKLSDASQHAKQADVAWAIRTFLPNDASIYSNANQVFEQTVQLTVAKQLHELLARELASPNNVNANQLYLTLRAYLMLSNPNQFNLASVTNVLDSSWSTGAKIAEFTELNKFVAQAFTQPPTLSLDNELIKNARLVLNSLPKSSMVLALFSVSFQGKPDLILPLPQINSVPVFNSNQTKIDVPAAFTADEFATVYDSITPQIANSLYNGDWVTHGSTLTNSVTADELEQVRQFYISSYIATWQTILSHLQLNPFRSYEQGAATISSFTQPNSPLLQLIYQIDINTNITYHNAPTPISLAFAPFNQSVNQVLAANRDNFLQLSNYLLAIAQENDRGAAAFELIKAHTQLPKQQNDAFDALNAQIATLPYPYNHWLNDMNQFSWQLILTDAQKTINQAWQDSVYSEFVNNLSEFYPFTLGSPQDLALTDFNHFFAPNGTFAHFLSFYLAPFIDMTQSTWAFKSFNGAHLPFSNSSLVMLQQANQITQAFFPNSSDQMSLTFLLKPVQLSSNIKQVDLSIDNQSAQYSADFMVATHFDWPGKNPSHYIAIVLSSQDGQQVNATMSGAWSFFHWLDTLQAEGDNKTAYRYTNPPYAFDFQLMDDKGTQPLTLNVLHGLSLPSGL